MGAGEFGDVLFGRLCCNSQAVAIKALRKDKTDMFALLQEAFILQLASCTEFSPRYIGLAPFWLLGDEFQEWAIILEFVGDRKKARPYDFRQTLRLTQHSLRDSLDWIYTSAKICQAVSCFHSMRMLLNDIKADNILLRPTGHGYHPVFIDFGLASIGEGITLAMDVNDRNKAKILKEYSHIAPEVLFGGETSAASDVFSLGKALSLVAEVLRLQPFTALVNQCLSWNTSERPTAYQLIDSMQWLTRSLCQQ